MKQVRIENDRKESQIERLATYCGWRCLRIVGNRVAAYSDAGRAIHLIPTAPTRASSYVHASNATAPDSWVNAATTPHLGAYVYTGTSSTARGPASFRAYRHLANQWRLALY